MSAMIEDLTQNGLQNCKVAGEDRIVAWRQISDKLTEIMLV